LALDTLVVGTLDTARVVVAEVGVGLGFAMEHSIVVGVVEAVVVVPDAAAVEFVSGIVVVVVVAETVAGTGVYRPKPHV
jgi:hypothetical protein